ncbi:MAG: hypothetical protein HZA66_01420 [Rhodopseudomonas palustris]|uniref:Bacteriophage Mx8 p63 C-terminal domain-containing protein n=1 Tax=Rhodopseudomonas palustris TaxID=1076 RepID=A0A933VZ51_RHOPL|nr:hypothetical protein [Rhodopseudomonas palustris]
MKTFRDQFYAQLFRLRGLKYDADLVKRPQYFGTPTNDVWKWIAPGGLPTKAGYSKERQGAAEGNFVSSAHPQCRLSEASRTFGRDGRIHDRKL